VPAAAGRRYNVACGQRTTLNQLLEILGRLAGRDLTPEYAAARAGDIHDSVADISRARQELGFQPVVTVEEGLRRLLEYERTRR
jgi:nucleoside-diphosphate-sugar epimerase